MSVRELLAKKLPKACACEAPPAASGPQHPPQFRSATPKSAPRFLQAGPKVVLFWQAMRLPVAADCQSKDLGFELRPGSALALAV